MNIVFATATSQVSSGGVPVMVRKGSHWRADDPLVKAYPSLFSTDARFGLSATDPSMFDEDPGVSTVEQATAAPGERRQVRRSA